MCLTFSSLSKKKAAIMQCGKTLQIARLAFVPIPKGCGAKRSHLGPLPRLGLSQLTVIALIRGVRIPFTIGKNRFYFLSQGALVV